ncbi:TetR family transcriptional regulator [Paenarthrobacter sp. Z7-10]|uniref:TetR/AcrR family transcriptional regulator n=1 Tax=Paenarthrobacter sp. Z7-10 TaxID=2787635 RepID=UPI0022A9A7BB|nr:TetR/AcrR family transcriptional regulator [Paenarthrobacter sp. Z7-10]MCZ2401843.1 TetR family transcriptional regulator [Paenarthrobacter sp. Z7-10]
MSKVVEAEQGLRARKRAAAEASIEQAALTLALERGYENVTVEMICEASMISQRTFFNYFGSKEGVILGTRPATPAEEEIRRFVTQEGSDVLGDLVSLIAAAMSAAEPDMALFQSRRTLIQRTPELMMREKARLGDAEGRLTKYVMDRFHTQGRSETKTPDLEDEARMVVALAFGALHYTMHKWVNSSFSVKRGELLETTSNLIRRATGNEKPA